MSYSGKRREGKDERLAFLRRENAMWLAVNPDAANWDATFLLDLIDELLAKSRIIRL